MRARVYSSWARSLVAPSRLTRTWLIDNPDAGWILHLERGLAFGQCDVSRDAHVHAAQCRGVAIGDEHGEPGRIRIRLPKVEDARITRHSSRGDDGALDGA